MNNYQIFFNQIEQDYEMLDNNFMTRLDLQKSNNNISPELVKIFEAHKIALNRLNKQRNDLIKEIYKLFNC